MRICTPLYVCTCSKLTKPDRYDADDTATSTQAQHQPDATASGFPSQPVGDAANQFANHSQLETPAAQNINQTPLDSGRQQNGSGDLYGNWDNGAAVTGSEPEAPAPSAPARTGTGIKEDG